MDLVDLDTLRVVSVGTVLTFAGISDLATRKVNRWYWRVMFLLGAIFMLALPVSLASWLTGSAFVILGGLLVGWRPPWLGGADGKALAALGIAGALPALQPSGWPHGPLVLDALVWFVLILLVVSLVALKAKGKDTNANIPAVALLAIGYWAASFWGNPILALVS